MANLPALSKTYSVRANTPYQANTTALLLSQSLVFSLKQHMINAIVTGTLSGTRNANSVWTVKGSSNSVAAALDNADRWTTHTDLVWNNNGSAHSWIVLENATAGVQVCIDCNSSTTSSLGIAVTEIAAPFTGGSTTSRPTSTSEFCFASSSTGAAQTVAGVVADQATGNTNFTHYVTADSGAFYFAASRTGLGLFSTFIALQKTSGNHVSDTRNVFGLVHGLSTGRGAPGLTTLVDTGAAGCPGRYPNNSGVHTTGGIQRASMFGSTNYASANGLDALSGNFLSFPCQVTSLGTQVAYRGIIPDLYIVGTATVGASVPSAAAQERVVMGDFIVPFPSVNPTI